MKKLVKFSLATLVIATLAACSSGGKGGSDNKPAANNSATKPATTNTSSSKPTTPAAATASTYGDIFYNGKAYGIDDASQHPQKLVVAGREFVLQQPGFFVRGFTTNSGNTVINGKTAPKGAVSGTKFDVRFGYLEQGNYVGAFYQGNNPTKETLSGVATYVGDAVYAKEGKFTTQVDKVKLDVNFDNKTVSGTVFGAEDGIAEVTIKNATIDGNAFSGKVAQGGQEADLKGKFFGTNASEVAGAYANGQGKDGWQGAFGAKKQ